MAKDMVYRRSVYYYCGNDPAASISEQYMPGRERHGLIEAVVCLVVLGTAACVAAARADPFYSRGGPIEGFRARNGDGRTARGVWNAARRRARSAGATAVSRFVAVVNRAASVVLSMVPSVL